MRLGISGLFLKPTQVGGAEFMLQGLLVGLTQLPDLELFVFISSNLLQWLDDLKQSDRLTPVPIPIHGNRFVAEVTQVPCIAQKLNLDGVIYPNYFTPARIFHQIEAVTAILDLNYRHFPEQFSWRKRLWLNLAHRFTLLNADITVTISQFVRKDLERAYKLVPRHPPVSIPVPILWDRFEARLASAPSFQHPFVLSVANHYQHKNLVTLLRAFHQLPKHLDEVHLVLVGQLPESLVGMRRDRCDNIQALVKELGLQHRVCVTGYITDAELGWYYRNAEIFAYPSLFEGFGMPPVEALGMGLPTLTTRCTSIPEVTLGLAQYVSDPLDIAEWCDRIVEIISSRANYVPSSEAIAKIRAAYDPVVVAQQYVNLFEQLRSSQ